MNITMIDDSYAFDGATPGLRALGGAEKAFVHLSSALAVRGHSVTVINRCEYQSCVEGVLWVPFNTPRPPDNDVIIAFSGSGKSKNVVKALELAKESGAYLIGFTGMSGGDFIEICDICIKIPSTNMLTIESFHLMLCHIIISCIREKGTPEFSYE